MSVVPRTGELPPQPKTPAIPPQPTKEEFYAKAMNLYRIRRTASAAMNVTNNDEALSNDAEL